MDSQSDAVACIFYYAILLLENQSANSSLESYGINSHLPISPRPEAKDQNGTVNLFFISDMILVLGGR